MRHIDTGMGPIPDNEDGSQDDSDDEEIVETTVPMQVPAESLNDQITAAVLQPDRNIGQLPTRNERPISEFTEGYFQWPTQICFVMES